MFTRDTNLSPSNAANLARQLVQEMVERADRKEAARKRAAEKQRQKSAEQKEQCQFQ